MMHYGFDDSPPAIVTLDSVRSRWPDASLSTPWPDEKDGASISGHVWVLGVDDVPPYIASCGEWSSNEYDALGEMPLFLSKARAAYFSKGRQDRVAEVDRFASQITYLDRKAFDHGVKTISDEWISRIDSGETIVAALPSANDKKDRGVASSEFILAHVFDNIRFACGSLATKKIALLAPDSEISSEIYKSDTIEYVEDWLITGNQARRNIGSFPESVRERFSIRLLVKHGLERVLELENGVSIPVSGVYELPKQEDVHAGPSTIGFHSSVNYGWQNRIIEFGLDIAEFRDVSPWGRTLLPLLTHIERPYRTRRDTPKFFQNPEQFRVE